MPLPHPVKHCPICGDKVKGRSDKIFCSPDCKAVYHYNRSTQRDPITGPIDKILHRNWVVLQEQYELAGIKKFYVEKNKLQKDGFKPNYYTTSLTNSKNKVYYYIYNFGWMDFSNKQLMVTRLSKPK